MSGQNRTMCSLLAFRILIPSGHRLLNLRNTTATYLTPAYDPRPTEKRRLSMMKFDAHEAENWLCRHSRRLS